MIKNSKLNDYYIKKSLFVFVLIFQPVDWPCRPVILGKVGLGLSFTATAYLEATRGWYNGLVDVGTPGISGSATAITNLPVAAQPHKPDSIVLEFY